MNDNSSSTMRECQSMQRPGAALALTGMDASERGSYSSG